MAVSIKRFHLGAVAIALACLAVAGGAGYLLLVDYYSELARASDTLGYAACRASAPCPPLLEGWRVAYLAVAASALLFLVGLHWHTHRRISDLVRHDVKSLLRMFRDVRQGAIRVDYPMELEEFSDVFQYLRDSGKKLVEEKQKLTDMGLVDHLSQLSNRRHFEQRLKELYDTSKSHGPSSVLIIDVDKFKQVNDQYGHDAGDALITGFSAALRRCVRQTDFLARLGGDEFCVLYPYTSLEQAKAFADRLRRELPRELTLTHNVRHHLRWTGGLSVMIPRDKTFEEVLWRADQALIKAKEAGRNITFTFNPAQGAPEKRAIMPS